jgi:hypothetical protein
MSCQNNHINRPRLKYPRKNPDHTSEGECALSFSLDERTNPAEIITSSRGQRRGEFILKESTSTRAVIAPAAVEWIEIFHHIFKAVNKSDIKNTPSINVFIKTGIGYRIIIYDVTAYRMDAIKSGSILSLLSSIDHEVI